MSSKSKKAASQTSGIQYDSQTKAVTTALDPGQQKFINQKIASVSEVVTDRSKNEISLVLQYYDYNVGDTIAAFTEDGAATALQAWNCTGPKKSKKKDSEKTDVVGGQAASATSVDQRSDGSKKINPAAGIAECQNGSPVDSTNIRVNEASLEVNVDNSNKALGGSQRKGKPSVPANNRGSYRNQKDKKREVGKESITESTDDERSRGKKGIEKCAKDLGRHALSLQRTRVLLNEEIEKSEKRLKHSFQELHRLLDGRESELAKELNGVKQRANELFNARQESASKLKMATDRANSMTENELNELRIDIKHFVSERKLDDELGRTTRFIRDHDRLVKEIHSYGEVTPAKNQYTGRRQSQSSTTSSLTRSDPSGSSVTSPITKNPVPSDFVARTYSAPAAAKGQALTSSEMAELQEKLHASLRLQGLPTCNAPVRQSRPKNVDGDIKVQSGKTNTRGPLANGARTPASTDGGNKKANNESTAASANADAGAQSRQGRHGSNREKLPFNRGDGNGDIAPSSISDPAPAVDDVLPN